MKSQTLSTKLQTNLKFKYQMTETGLVRRRRIAHCDLPFDLAQGGELVEPFDICDLEFFFLHYSITPTNSL
jgi:hypothetical protein